MFKDLKSFIFGFFSILLTPKKLNPKELQERIKGLIKIKKLLFYLYYSAIAYDFHKNRKDNNI